MWHVDVVPLSRSAADSKTLHSVIGTLQLCNINKGIELYSKLVPVIM